ncbi:hypothetical protein [Marinobacter apostichopi]|uniref:hypothetical protein n=1 Tax=Marinobacter apostichopi TaxID=3035454 RepID=UPI0025743C0D|nr:hypothetical protein [Marinobacter sp. LA51]
MTDDPDKQIKELWDDGLADDEIFCIGKIVAHWGAIEHEIFYQTLSTYVGKSGADAELPKAMNNLRFSAVLKLWEERVVKKAEGSRRAVLEEQKRKIESYQDSRNALVHGMWDWKRDQPDVVTTTRVKKKQIITTSFNEGDLYHFYTELAQINLLIRYPGGLQEAFEEQASNGLYINEAELRRLSRKSKHS